jgi:hypothetical protein
MNNVTTREDIIDLIELRIQTEFQKHQDSLGTIECAKIAARKITSSLFMIYDVKEKD